MIENFTEGQAKDEILKYCIGQNNKIIASTELQNELFKNISVDDVNLLLLKMSNECNGFAKINLNGRTKYVSTNKAAESFIKQGGFSKMESDSNSESDLLKVKENLDLEIKVLQKDNFEYEKIIREQNDRIRNLDEQIKFISLIKLYWWLIPICITIGIFLVKIWTLIMQGK